MKTTLKGKDARASIRNGINAVADAVKITHGPAGRNVIIGRVSQTPLITNDGKTITDYIESENEIEQLGVLLAREVASLTEKEAGDGTTTATVLYQALVNKCFDMIDNGDVLLKSQRVNPWKLRAEITEACEKVIGELKGMAKPITTKEEIYKVAKSSVEDEELANLLTDIFFTIGKNGVVVVEEGMSKTVSETIKGLEIPSGLVSEHFKTSDTAFEAQSPRILVTTNKIATIEELLPAVELLLSKGIMQLVVFARDFDENVLKVIEKQHILEAFTILPVKSTDPSKKYQQEDVAALTGATIFDNNKLISTVKLEDFGTCEKIEQTKDKTMFIGGKTNDEYVAKLTKEASEKTSEFEKDRIERRISSLSGGIALIKVGASSQSEREYLKLKLDDAVLAVRYAMQEGVVRGGGIALKEIAEKLPENILTSVIVSPYNQIQDNAGGQLEINDGVVDPVRVTISALTNACSSAGVLITTEIANNDKHEKPKTQEED